MKVLIFGTSYVDSQERKWLAEQWLRVTKSLNPGVDVLAVDTPGSVDWLPQEQWSCQFVDNIGHLAKNSRDGWGRAFVKGIEVADMVGADYAVHIECDLLLAKPVMPVIDLMANHGIMALSTSAYPHRFMETGILFLDMSYVKESRLIERYDWENPVPGLPERRVEALLGDDLFLMPWWGFRDDYNVLEPDALKEHFPAGMDWITHASVPCYKRFMDMNGLRA